MLSGVSEFLVLAHDSQSKKRVRQYAHMSMTDIRAVWILAARLPAADLKMLLWIWGGFVYSLEVFCMEKRPG